MGTDKGPKKTLNANARRSIPSQHLSLTSRMAEGGIIVPDGIVDDAIEFHSGALAKTSFAEIHGGLMNS